MSGKITTALAFCSSAAIFVPPCLFITPTVATAWFTNARSSARISFRLSAQLASMRPPSAALLRSRKRRFICHLSCVSLLNLFLTRGFSSAALRASGSQFIDPNLPKTSFPERDPFVKKTQPGNAIVANTRAFSANVLGASTKKRNIFPGRRRAGRLKSLSSPRTRAGALTHLQWCSFILFAAANEGCHGRGFAIVTGAGIARTRHDTVCPCQCRSDGREKRSGDCLLSPGACAVAQLGGSVDEFRHRAGANRPNGRRDRSSAHGARADAGTPGSAEQSGQRSANGGTDERSRGRVPPGAPGGATTGGIAFQPRQCPRRTRRARGGRRSVSPGDPACAAAGGSALGAGQPAAQARPAQRCRPSL